MSDDFVNPSTGAGSQTFKFRSVIGAEVSFKDFNQFRFFDETSNVLIAVADIPSNVVIGGAGSTPSGGGNSVIVIDHVLWALLFAFVYLLT